MPVADFCLFLAFQEINIKRSPNGEKIWINFFWTKRDPRSFRRRPEESRGSDKLTRPSLPTRARLAGLSLPRDSSGPSKKLRGSLMFQKNHQKVSANSENFYFCTKNNTTVVLLKITSVRISSNQIIPKPYKIVINMA